MATAGRSADVRPHPLGTGTPYDLRKVLWPFPPIELLGSGRRLPRAEAVDSESRRLRDLLRRRSGRVSGSAGD